MKRYIENATDQVMIVGGRMIPPGEGREIDEAELPPEHGEAAAAGEPAPDDPDAVRLANLQELLAHPLKDILPQLAGFSAQTLGDLAELERQADRPRSTLLSSIAELELNRAQERAGGAPT